MTDEERLERLKKISDNVSLNGAMSTHLRLADLLFLIGQAERARELEEDLQLSEQEESSRWEELSRCRETLKFYANPNNYNETDNFMSNINADSGARARRELEGLE